MHRVKIGVGDKPLTKAEAEHIKRATISPVSRGIIFADNFGRIFTDTDRMAELQSSHIIACLRNRQEGIGDLDPYRDLGYFSDGFNSALKITFAIYHAFREVRHPGYLGASSPTYTLPEGFCPSSLGLEIFETENDDFEKIQISILMRANHYYTTKLYAHDKDQIIRAHDLGVDFGTDFITECLAQRSLDFELAYYAKDITAVLTA